MCSFERDDQAFRQMILSIPIEQRRILLRILDASPERRANAIGRLFQAGRGASPLPELLMDLEECSYAMAVLRPMIRETLLRG